MLIHVHVLYVDILAQMSDIDHWLHVRFIWGKFNDACILKRVPLLTAAFVQENPSIITMAGGMPNPQTFPILEATLKLRYASNDCEFYL